MWALALALLAAGGLVKVAAARPSRLKAAQIRELARLAASERQGVLTLDRSEDGAVLARKFARPDLEQKFKRASASLKKHRD